jgi:hypothetical protein
MGSALSTFTDFVASTGPAYLTSADDVVNEAVKNSYLLGRFLKGADKAFVLQGGANIKDVLMLDEQSTAINYQPDDTFVWSGPQVASTLALEWRFTSDHMKWSDQEVELNAAGASSESRFQQFKARKRMLEQRLWTSKINFMEDRLFAVPNKATMEATTGADQYSIPAFVNEHVNGLFGEGVTGTDVTTVGSKWTVVETIDPAVKTRWVPQLVQYGSATVNDTGATLATTNIVQAFDEMFHKVRFQTPPTKQEYFENGKMYAQFIACSRKGLTIYQNLLRASQDRFTGVAGFQDPAFVSPSFAGIDLVYVRNLDTAAIYENEAQTGYVAESNASNDTGENQGPRYYWLNGQYLCPVFHSSRYMEKKAPMVHPNQPYTTVVPVDTWWNIVCRSRQRQGIVGPGGSANVYNYTPA